MDRGFVEVANITDEELSALLRSHFEPLLEGGKGIDQSCPLFGGLILEVDGTRLIYPQCCGDLADVATWLEPAYSGSGVAAVAPAGHPCPEIICEGAMVRVVCFDPDFPFVPAVDRDLVVAGASLRAAVAGAMAQLAFLSVRLNRISDIAAHPGLASVLAGSTRQAC